MVDPQIYKYHTRLANCELEMLPKPMRDLDADEARWFIELDQAPVTQEEKAEARKSLHIFRSIKLRE